MFTYLYIMKTKSKRYVYMDIHIYSEKLRQACTQLHALHTHLHIYMHTDMIYSA